MKWLLSAAGAFLCATAVHVQPKGSEKIVTETKKASLITTNTDTATGPWMLHHKTVEHKKKAGAGYLPGSPLFEGEVENIPISTTMKCIMNLSIQYFLVYTLIAILRTVQNIQNPGSKMKSKALETMEAATPTVAYVPMMSVLFLGVRMRAVQLSQNQTEKYDLPNDMTQNFMQVCTWAVLIQLLMVLLMPLLMGKVPETDADGNILIPENDAGGKGAQQSKDSGFVMVLQVIRFTAMLMLYGGIVVVIVQAFLMEGPKEIWGDKVPPVSPAVFSTMLMTFLYFYVFLQLAVLRLFKGPGGRPRYATQTAITEVAASCVGLAPMLCILFIGARMRALQIDPKTGAPQAWAQNCFYLCVTSLYVQVGLIMLVGFFVSGATIEKGDCEGDVRFQVGNPGMMSFLYALRFVALASLYGGLAAVIYSVFTIEHKDGPDMTPPISPAMNCVMNLTAQYFFVYLALYIIITIHQFANATVLPRSAKAFEAAQKTVMFCPMLAIIFIGVRMRALQITSGAGAPPGYAQDCMFLSTWAVLMQLILCLVMPCAMKGDVETDEDGNVKATGQSGMCLYFLEAYRYFCMISMYGGAVGIVHGLLTMTPTTANGEGHLLPWFKIPEPVSASETIASVEPPKVPISTSF